MGYKKKKNIIAVTLFVIISFILYQLYFFLAITDASNNTPNVRYVPVLDHAKLENMKVVRTAADRYIDELGHIRGVYSRNMRLYLPDRDSKFKCLNSEQKVLHERINDDYCDCEDGTDEPSTNACVNGTFYCQTQVKVRSSVVTIIPSSMVNDGICDCCDGSDEWLHQPNQMLLSQNIKRKRHYVMACPNVCV